MELYCIKTHPDKVVIAGNLYPFISDKPLCKCKDLIDVGVKLNHYANGNKLNIGDTCTCRHCNCMHRHDGIWWVKKSYFVNIDDINIEEINEALETRELQEI